MEVSKHFDEYIFSSTNFTFRKMLQYSLLQFYKFNSLITIYENVYSNNIMLYRLALVSQGLFFYLKKYC